MATKKAAAKKVALIADAQGPTAEPGPQPEATEGAALLATGGDFTPPPVDKEPPAPAGQPESRPVESRVDVNPEWIGRRNEAIAKVCHEANRALCLAFGDDSQKPWAEAADWQRESAIKGVEFAMANPDADPRAQHAAWCRDKIAAGWGYGAVKDERNKTHPCLVDFDYLPPEQKAKDYVFKAIVRAMLPG